ncbi:MAG TPA: TlpA family protein disulfide reductase, partial [Candidatus Solibacter sp.]|nr:TlpA family protein disulfide reductase [Candidatus Solibacter sp.]
LGDLDAWVPLANQDGGGPSASNGLVWLQNQYRAALDQARREGKLVFVNFTGYACTNCHWMKANMFTRPEIAAAMKDFVLVELYTDGSDAASDENQKLQLDLFKTVAIPYYAILDPDGKVVASFPSLTRDPKEYLAFLQTPKPATASGDSLPTPTTFDGKPFQMPTGKVVVVDFWATWCIPCIKEIPSFNKIYKEYASKGVAVVGIGMDEEGTAKIQPFARKKGIEYPVAVGKPEFNETYKLDQLPVTLVFDRTGKLVKRFQELTPEAELLNAVQKAL